MVVRHQNDRELQGQAEKLLTLSLTTSEPPRLIRSLAWVHERCVLAGSPLGLFAFFANAIQDTVDKVNRFGSTKLAGNL